MMQLGFGLGLTMQQSGGGGGDVTAPVITDAALVGGTMTANVNEPGTAFWLFNLSATPLTGAAIISSALGSAAIAGGINYIPVDDSGLTPGVSYYLHLTVRDAASNSTTPGAVIGPYIVPIPSFLETWSSYVAGNTFTELDPAYSRTDTAALTTIVSDASGPSGLACQISAGAHKSVLRDDITSALAARTTERVQVRVKWRLLATANARGGFGHRVSLDSNTGILVQRFGATNHSVYLQVAGNPSTGTNTTALASSLNDNAILWTLIEIDGVDLKGKAWLDGAGEPGSWTTRTEASAIAIASMGPAMRAGAPSHQILGYRVAIGADAGSF